MVGVVLAFLPRVARYGQVRCRDLFGAAGHARMSFQKFGALTEDHLHKNVAHARRVTKSTPACSPRIAVCGDNDVLLRTHTHTHDTAGGFKAGRVDNFFFFFTQDRFTT